MDEINKTHHGAILRSFCRSRWGYSGSLPRKFTIPLITLIALAPLRTRWMRGACHETGAAFRSFPDDRAMAAQRRIGPATIKKEKGKYEKIWTGCT